MLGVIRKYQRSVIIKIVFGIIVLSFLGTIFLIWGRGEKGESGAYAVKVDGDKVPIEEFQRTYERLKNIYGQLYGQGLTPEAEKAMGLKKMALETLVDSVLIRKEARRMGIKVKKDEVAAEIAKVTAFQVNGAFDFQQYQQILRSSRITPAAFEESQKQTLLAQKARKAVMDKVKVTDEEALQAFKKQSDRLDLQFVSFAPADVKGEVKLSDQELQSYLQKHQDAFRTQERISISYLLLEPSRAGAKLSVSEDEAQTYYQKNIDRYQGKGGILPYADVRERAKADALKQKSAKQAYELAADALNKQIKSGDIAAAAKALGVKVVDTPLFAANSPHASIAGETELLKKAFMLKTGEMGGPVETSKGVYLLKVRERKPAEVPPLSLIKAQVEPGAREEKARELARTKAAEALALLTKGGAAKVQETGGFASSAKGDIPRIGASPEIMDAAFNLTTAAPVAKTPFKAGERWYAVKLKSRVELNKEDFQRAREQVKQAMLPKKQEKAVTEWLDGLRKKAKIVYNPALIAE